MQPELPRADFAHLSHIPGIDYFTTVRNVLNPGAGDMMHPRHDKELVRREELQLVNLLENLSEDEKARLDEEITLVPKYND